MLTIDSPKTRPVRLAPPYRFTREDYHAMAEVGIFGEDDHVELIAGEIITQMPIGTAHSSMVNRLNRCLARHAGERVIVSVQNPVALNDFSEPQPDVTLLRPRSDYYADSHPAPEDVMLLIEVADTSLAFDREEKIPLYAEAGIAEVWLVDLTDKSLTVFRSLTRGAYAEVPRHLSGARIAIPNVPDASLALSDLGL